jgi:4-hydroxybenzoate polyprenyltransferase
MIDITGRVADSTGNWVDTLAPAWSRPFLRLSRADRPIGGWLLLMPCWWSAGIAAVAAGHPYPNPWHVFLFFVGAFVMRGAGCTWNDILDRDLDAKVARTRSRPIPSSQVTTKAAVAFLVAQALVGLLVLVQFNGFTILMGILSLVTVAIYPLMKRVTWWPQVFLGLAFSWGALMGWPAVFGKLDAPALLLYVGSIMWVIGYDTIYAHQDREDDVLIGVHSTARLFGTRTRLALMFFYSAAVLLIGLAGVMAGAGPVFLTGCVLFAAHLGWQITRLDINDPDLCLRLFKSNRDAGLILFAALIGDAVYKTSFL